MLSPDSANEALETRPEDYDPEADSDCEVIWISDSEEEDISEEVDTVTTAPDDPSDSSMGDDVSRPFKTPRAAGDTSAPTTSKRGPKRFVRAPFTFNCGCCKVVNSVRYMECCYCGTRHELKLCDNCMPK